MSIESRVPQYGILFDSWQVSQMLEPGLFRLEHTDEPSRACALKVITVITEEGSLSALSEAQLEEYTTLRRQRRKEQEKRLLNIVGTDECLEYTFLDWEDAEGYGRDLLIRKALPEEASDSVPKAAISQQLPEDAEEPEESGGSNVLLKVLIVVLAVAILCVGFIFGKIVVTLKGQADRLSLEATEVTAVTEMPTEAPTEAPAEVPTEAPVILDPTKLVDMSIGRCHAAALYEDGSVDVVYLNESMRKKYPAWDVWDASGTAEWTDIMQISVNKFHMAGLKSDGTVVAVGGNDSGECDVDQWTDIIAIATGEHVTVGLKSDGTLVCAGNTQKLGSLDHISDVTAINLGSGCLEYLQSDGSWKRIQSGGSEQTLGVYPELVKIYCNENDSLGILSDGTVVVGRTTQLTKTKLAEWTDIVDIYGDSSCLLGLKSNGTVCAVGFSNQNYQQNVAHWSDVKKLSGPSLGIRNDGSFILSGTSLFQSFDLSSLNKAASVSEGQSGRVVSSVGVNVRSYPGINCDIVTRLAMDTPVIVLETKTTYDGMLWGRTMYGWISMDYIALD